MVECIAMSLEFIKQMNEYVIDATMTQSDEDILSTVGKYDAPGWDTIRAAHSIVIQAVIDSRQSRLEKKKSEFLAAKEHQKSALKLFSVNKTVPEMLADIVKAMQNKEKVPDGLLMAFREQGQNGSEDDIKDIWQSLVQLGLIEPSDDEH